MTTERWTSCLDRLAAHLVHQERALTDGRLERLSTFTPDADLGPLPIEAQSRVEELQERAEALTRSLETELARTEAALSALRQQQQEPARPSFVDARC